MRRKVIPRSFGTHNGTFHADEVTACALLFLFNQIDLDKIIRSRDPNKLNRCDFVCDVGGIYDPSMHWFDHHQLSYHGDLSSAGMVLNYLKEQKVLQERLFNYLNSSLIIGVDAIDNGNVSTQIGHCSFSGVIANFIPTSHDASEEKMKEAFMEALDFTINHLKRLLSKFNYIQKCRKVIEEEMKKNQKVMLFDASMPWFDVFFELGGEKHPALFVIMPAGKHWKLRGIPPSYDRRMEVRFPLPSKWAGLHSDELAKESGIKGAIFCHKGAFISIWQTKEDAIEALQIAFKSRKA